MGELILSRNHLFDKSLFQLCNSDAECAAIFRNDFFFHLPAFSVIVTFTYIIKDWVNGVGEGEEARAGVDVWNKGMK